MDSQTVDSQIKEIIIERLFLDVEPEEIEPDAPLIDLGIDSFMLLELIVGVEECFEVRFAQSDINPQILKTLASLRQAVIEKLNAAE